MTQILVLDSLQVCICSDTFLKCARQVEAASQCSVNNIIILVFVCITLLLLALIITKAVRDWHTAEIAAQAPNNRLQECCPTPKQEYISKLIAFQEELAKKDSKLKPYTDEACKNYIEFLKDLISHQS